jgi:hypothetical protein
MCRLLQLFSPSTSMSDLTIMISGNTLMRILRIMEDRNIMRVTAEKRVINTIYISKARKVNEK